MIDRISKHPCPPEPQRFHREDLNAQKTCFQGTSRISREIADTAPNLRSREAQTQGGYLSRFADARPAPLHVPDGLPNELVLARVDGRVSASVISEFILDGEVLYPARRRTKSPELNSVACSINF